MSPTETYLFLLADSFMSGLVLPIRYELVFTAMKIFGGYNLYFAGLISTIGITIASTLNWLLGRALRTFKKDVAGSAKNAKLEEILTMLKTHGHWAGLLGFIPILGPIVIVFTGIVQSKFLRVILLVFIVNLLWKVGMLEY